MSEMTLVRRPPVGVRCMIAVIAATVSFAAVAAGSGAWLEAHAQSHGGAPRGMFERMDADGDGRVTQAEMRAARERMRERADLDRDGAVTRDEIDSLMRARMAERAAKRFAKLDADGDGRIVADEFARHDEARFAQADADGDGAVTRDEMRRAMRRHHGVE